MERPELTLVTQAPERTSTPWAAALGSAVLAAAALATLFGADAARRSFAPGPLAESALARTLTSGDPEPVRVAQTRLKERLRRTPLDGASRTIAASLVAETAGTVAAKDEAARQAQEAIRLNPLDDGVARAAARVLARCGRADLALREISKMFGYAPDEAAAALADVEPFLADDQIVEGLPDSAAAWLAWSVELRATGRADQADARLAALLSRWPSELPARTTAASIAAGRGRFDDLARLVPPSLALPRTAEAATLYAYRAQSKIAAHDPAGARADVLLAIELSHEDPWVLSLAGDVLSATDAGLAREYWTRALYLLLAKPSTRDGAIWVRLRLARLDDREGRAGDALHAWRSILVERPDDAEAKRRIAELTGEVPR